ncbi:MAG TPA: DUF1847 domain-containing protein [Candidatus Methanofastidiosa archaeon]|nr:DUF1847 domain-containing protein [Candidatus Methanofastidiosa archaeon]
MTSIRCDKCPGYYCFAGNWTKEKAPEGCPMIEYPEIFERVCEDCKDEEFRALNIPATKVEKDGFAKVNGKNAPCYPRLREIVEYAKASGMTHIGLAFCKAVSNEAAIVGKVLESFGLEVDAILCKCGGINKEDVGVPKENKIRGPDAFEPSCNPVVQAQILNDRGTDINVLIGLCLGHDMIFTKHSNALVTTLIVKDKVTGNNPQAALYNVFSKRAYFTP